MTSKTAWVQVIFLVSGARTPREPVSKVGPIPPNTQEYSLKWITESYMKKRTLQVLKENMREFLGTEKGFLT